jgi:SAM-dependent methyltransferase
VGIVDRPAGDVDYSRYGVGYGGRRRTDPRIAELVTSALGPVGPVLNVGAGAGSYEPTDRPVVAVEPSEAMLAQRPDGSAPVVRAVAGALPVADGAVAASMAMVTIHQWPDPLAGLAELRRVTVGPVVVLTFDPGALDALWLAEYSPELHAAESRRYPTIDAVVSALGAGATATPVPVPFDCLDGFTEAFYGRPEAFLDPAVRRSQSAWSFVSDDAQARAVDKLAGDLASGRWDDRFGHLRHQEAFIGSLRLVVGHGHGGHPDP